MANRNITLLYDGGQFIVAPAASKAPNKQPPERLDDVPFQSSNYFTGSGAVTGSAGVSGSSGSKSSGGGSSKKQTVADYYNQIIKQLGNTSLTPSEITYDPLDYVLPSQVELSQQIAEYLRPQYDSAIKNRQQQTSQNRAAIDVDAASRGMTSSTWTTDAKNRQAISEAADIASLESAYGSALAQNVLDLYNQHLQNKLNVDTFNKSNQLTVQQQNAANKLTAEQWNAEMLRALQEMAYNMAMDAYSLSGSKKGSGVTDTTGFTANF